jgi:hypothetical protein
MGPDLRWPRAVQAQLYAPAPGVSRQTVILLRDGVLPMLTRFRISAPLPARGPAAVATAPGAARGTGGGAGRFPAGGR